MRKGFVVALILVFLAVSIGLGFQLWQSQKAQLRLEWQNLNLREQIRKERFLCGQAIRKIQRTDSHSPR